MRPSTMAIVAGSAPACAYERLDLERGLDVLRIRHAVRDDRGFKRHDGAAACERRRDARSDLQKTGEFLH